VTAFSFAEVIGDPIAQSKSPILHGFWLEALGIDASYGRQQLRRDELAPYLSERRKDPAWRGCNVTLPHKQAVLELVDAVDPVAARIGAVNTIVPTGGRLVGYNTDAPGFLEPLAPWLSRPHLLRTARILGTGGAARAIAHALWSQGFTLIIAGRDLAKAEALADEFDRADAHACTLDTFARPLAFDWKDMDGRFDLLVNATSLGMSDQPALSVDFSNVPPNAVVYDAVYAPLITPLLREAAARLHPTIGGLAMLIGQGRIAFRHFFGVDAPDDPASDAALIERLTG
jgi:shikimate dehydrogenase